MYPLPTDDDPRKRRRQMVAEQLIPRGIRDVGVLEAMERVPRHCFVPPALEDVAYADRALPIGHGQTISQPYVVASMLQYLELNGEDRVLDVGTGSGYQAALLTALAARVDSVELDEELAALALRNLSRAAVSGVAVHVGDGSLGLVERAPYDAIVVGAGAPEVPEALISQLAEGGRLVIPTGPLNAQVLRIVRRGPNGPETESSYACSFVPLRGVQGWSKDELAC